MKTNFSSSEFFRIVVGADRYRYQNYKMVINIPELDRMSDLIDVTTNSFAIVYQVLSGAINAAGPELNVELVVGVPPLLTQRKGSLQTFRVKYAGAGLLSFWSKSFNDFYINEFGALLEEPVTQSTTTNASLTNTPRWHRSSDALLAQVAAEGSRVGRYISPSSSAVVVKFAEARTELSELRNYLDTFNNNPGDLGLSPEELRALLLHLDACTTMLKEHLISHGLLTDTKTFLESVEKNSGKIGLAGIVFTGLTFLYTLL